ncbi:MAG: NAD(P)H-dependent glycerol-3-phosphate dehydrogenase [Sphingomonadales bacterium]|nr:NAD(P)H-dependent glycerol-3-phosphate dehydrogenase [Sphingomonadales bacterium]
MTTGESPIGIVGSGSWATALMKMISDGGRPVKWWIRNPEKATYIQEHLHNPDYLSSVEVHPNWVNICTDLQELVNTCETIILAIPSAFLHQALQGITLPTGHTYVSAIKGIEPKTQLVMAKYLEVHHNIPSDQIAIITGPCHAEEVAAEKLSYLTVAANRLDVAESIKQHLVGQYIKVKCCEDLMGAEYAAVMKNIYAIGAGIAHGLGYGDNFLALYTSCAIREMEAFLNAIDPNGERDVNEAAYLGDLLVTCYSQFSRNRTFGNMLGKGYSVKAAQLEMNMVAEGYYASKLVYAKSSKRALTLPIADAVYQVIYENANAKSTFRALSEKSLR